MRASGQDLSTDSQPATGGIVAPLTAAPYSWYALGVLILVALFNYIDRQSLAIPQIPIKH